MELEKLSPRMGLFWLLYPVNQGKSNRPIVELKKSNFTDVFFFGLYVRRERDLVIWSGRLKEKQEGSPKPYLEEREGDRDRLRGLPW